MILENKNDHSFIIDVPTKQKLSIPDIFGKQSKNILEIGCGHGHFINEVAKTRKDCCLLAFDKITRRLEKANKKLKLNNLCNVRLFTLNTYKRFDDLFEHNTFDEIIIYFPDPWPKRRHHKNRLIQKDFLIIIHKYLRNNGIVYLATDHLNYAIWITNIFNNLSDLFHNLHNSDTWSSESDFEFQSRFEKMKIKEKLEIKYFKYRKIQNATH